MFLKSLFPFILLTISLPILFGCSDNYEGAEAEFSAIPQFQQAFDLGSDDEGIQPLKLQIVGDTLFVAYYGKARIDKFTFDLVKIGSVEFDSLMPVNPTSFYITDSNLYVSDHSRQLIVVYDRDGKFIDAYGTLPDNTTVLSPMDLTFFGGVLYFTDIGLKKILAVSMTDAPGITEKGELILQIPDDSSRQIGFPSGLMITPDGRLLVGDALNGVLSTFTCDGRFIYHFDSVGAGVKIGPRAFACDDVMDPSLQDSLSFDPSGVRSLGRIHMVDALNGKIHLFNPLGKYINSYPVDSRLNKPSDIAISIKRKTIFVADPAVGRIFTFSYSG